MSDGDNRAEVELNLPDDALFQLMLMAHQHDITLNQMVEKILREEMARLDKEHTNERGD